MGTPLWFKSTPLERLRTTPQNFEFAQAVRLLEQSYYYNNKPLFDPLDQNTPLASIGSKALPYQEKIRFRQKVSLSFSAADLNKWVYQAGQGFEKNILDVSFLGLVGIAGALPTCFTELVLERVRLGDQALKDFLDIFQHRILSFFYRAETKYRILLRFEKRKYGNDSKHLNEETPFQSLHGNALPSQNISPTLPSGLGVFYAGFLVQKPRSAINLERLLSSYLSLPVYIDQFKGNWLNLSQEDWTKLSTRNGEGIHHQLGKGTLLGRKVWSLDHKFSLTVGPLSLKELSQFLPGSTYLSYLKQIINYYINNNLIYEIKLILKSSDIPFCQLKYKNSPQLGWTTWLVNKIPKGDRGDTTIRK